MKEAADRCVIVFANAARQHAQATWHGNPSKVNDAAGILNRAFKMICAHGTLARDLLLNLVSDPDQDVAVMAATYSLKFNPDRCIAALRQIAEEPTPAGFGARAALERWQSGDWTIE